MRQVVLEELFAGEVLEIGVVHPAIPDLLVGQGVGVLQYQHADHEAHRLRRATFVGKIPRQLIVYPGPFDLVRQGDKRVFHVDDLVETGAEQIVVARFHLLLRSHLIPQNQCQKGITNWSKNESKTQENKRQNPLFLQFQLLHICRNVRQDKAARVFNGELFITHRSLNRMNISA